MIYIGILENNKITGIRQTDVELKQLNNDPLSFYENGKPIAENVVYISPNILWHKNTEWVKTDNPQIINAMSSSVMLGLTETMIQQAPPELVNQIQEKVIEKLILPQITQPVNIVQTQGEPPLQYQGIIPTIFDEMPLKFEQKINELIRIPLLATGQFDFHQWFWNNLPRNLEQHILQRPPIYIVCHPEINIRPIEYTDNNPSRWEASVQFIIQGFGEYFENGVFETSNWIFERLLEEQSKSSNVRDINNGTPDYDSVSNLSSIVVSCFVAIDV